MELLHIDVNKPLLGVLVLVELLKKPLQFNIVYGTRTALECRDGSKVQIYTTENAILRYLALHYEKSLYWSSILDSVEIDQWLTMLAYVPDDLENLSRHLKHINTELSMVTYLVPHRLSLADIKLWSVIRGNPEILNAVLADTKKHQNIIRWLRFVDDNPAMQEVLIKTGLTSDASIFAISETLNIPDLGEFVTTFTVGPPPKGPEQKKKAAPVASTTVPILKPKPPIISSSKSEAPNSSRKDEGKFVDLPGAEVGKVVVRFPPEASGYLHIGHAKAALLNQYYRDAFKGKLIMRFDDTNPDKEKVDFEQVILGDLKLLNITPDMYSHTSDYFEEMLGYCEKLIKEGKAYVDDTDAEVMKQEREQKLESKNRNNDIAKNLSMWNEMKSGTEYGQRCCVRAKINMSAANGCMRDPTIYRCKNQPHPRTGHKYNVYPTYDFACPIVDSIEGVTHCLRTTEYHDRDEQFYWFIDALGLTNKPYIWEFSRLNMMNTVLSKRKLAWFVDQGLVEGWDDPRFPTVRGILRHGMTVEGLKQFIVAQGSSRSVVQMDWDKIWAFNKKVIDPIAPRYSVVSADNNVPVYLDGVTKEEQITMQLHPKNASIGEKKAWISPRVLIDYEDAEMLKEGEDATFVNWGNITITKIIRKNDRIEEIHAKPNLSNTDYKKTVKVTWISERSAIPGYCIYYDHIINKPVLGKDEDFKQFINENSKVEKKILAEENMKNVKKSDIIQILRKGFFICDCPFGMAEAGKIQYPIILFNVPDGHTKESPAQAAIKKESGGIKEVINEEKERLEGLKKSFKKYVDVDWDPNIDVKKVVDEKLKTSGYLNKKQIDQLHEDITKQGNKVRSMKAAKEPKDAIDTEVAVLITLKNDYKNLTGTDWKPTPVSPAPVPPPPASSNEKEVDKLNKKIVEQGNKVRAMKAAKEPKDAIGKEVALLLALKNDFKNLTGTDWKPAPIPSSAEKEAGEVSKKIVEEDNKVKSPKEAKKPIEVAMASLVASKKDYKLSTSTELKTSPEVMGSTSAASSSSEVEVDVARAVKILHEISVRGDIIRKLKEIGASNEEMKKNLDVLMSLKRTFVEVTGIQWNPSITIEKLIQDQSSKMGVASKQPREKTKVREEVEKPSSPKKTVQKGSELKEPAPSSVGIKKQTRLGLEAKKEENLADWYSQVITKGEMIEYYDVSGCYILRPWAYGIWESIQKWFDSKIKELGVQNCYFPIFVSRSVLEKEKTHIADFAPEVAWVTKSGNSDLAEHVAIRPTSETVMYPAYAKWIQSHRDLPLKLNQWNNVVRWEFKHPQPFLRTREFLWQEGHTAFASEEEAQKEVYIILDLYARIYTDLLAIPVIKGRKTEKEKFAGGDFTTTVEAYIAASGRGIQGATSHHLGQNFSKMFEILYEDPETKEKKFVYQNSWGITTRTIGVMIMVHSDNQGLVLPPRVAPLQVVIVPCGISANMKEEEKEYLYDCCLQLEQDVKNAGIRVKGDYRENYSPGWKFNHWELKGVPIRIEVGPKDIKQSQVIAVRRDTGDKIIMKRSTVLNDLKQLLNDIHDFLYNQALTDLETHTVRCEDWSSFRSTLDSKNIILAPFCGETPCEDRIKQDSARDEGLEPGAPSMGAKTLCIPFDQPEDGIKPGTKCIHPSCEHVPRFYVLFGRSY